MEGTLESELDRMGPQRFTDPRFGVGEVTHIVLFRFRDGITAEQIAEVEIRFRALAGSRHRDDLYITSIRAGFQNSGEGASGGYELGFVVTFASLGDRNFYVGEPVVTDSAFFDPEHARFKEFVGPFLRPGSEGVLVFDFQDTSVNG